MTYLTDTADRPRQGNGFDLAALDRTDRILLGSCAAVWLAALGAGVAATVALVDLSRGHTASSAESGTPWVLYTVIGVSALVIVAAVPLLLRARRATTAEPVSDERPKAAAPQLQSPVRGAEAPTEKFRAPAVVAEPSGPIPLVLQRPAGAAALEQLWLRSAVAIASAMGVATLLTGVSTYLMAVASDTVAWVLYGLAGVITVGMVAIPWYFLRELRALLEG
ncbi:DUF2561 family protein [Mycolicibacterium pyrenivorans]|uniref:DUF2561 family protein n=1 Tax=Mycolicibacterium pyrenivorans TaxID=187102 RepID=UPI0021F25E31|nr:DUF2561 family protein [Mycolicibacterium pyrenivorans]MCV7150707.1 DUF2561 family protein [Mycolicibacterium pyrenivorans]